MLIQLGNKLVHKAKCFISLGGKMCLANVSNLLSAALSF